MGESPSGPFLEGGRREMGYWEGMKGAGAPPCSLSPWPYAPSPPASFALSPLTLTQVLPHCLRPIRSLICLCLHQSTPFLLCPPPGALETGNQRITGLAAQPGQSAPPSCAHFLGFGPGPPLPLGPPCCQKTPSITMRQHPPCPGKLQASLAL